MDKSYKRKPNYKPGGGSNNSWNNKRKFKNYLQPGMKGFLCTCNTREKDCVRESFNILNEYADTLYGSDEIPHQVKAEDTEGAEEASGDIEDELKKEVTSLKSNQWAPRRFSNIDTGVKNNIFIKTTLEDPVHLVYTILNDIATTKTQKARFLLRIVPVEMTCKANLEDIKKAADSLFDKHFKCEPTTFAVVINKRYNDSVLRDEVIKALALLVTDRNQEHKANLKDAKLTVLVEIMKGLCCLTVLEDYKRLRHYNLAELTKPEKTEDDKTTEQTHADETGQEENCDNEGDEGNGEDPEEKEEQENHKIDRSGDIKEEPKEESKSNESKLDPELNST